MIELLHRERTQFVGTILMKENFAYLIPDNQKSGVQIQLPKEKLNGAKDQDKVIAKITVWPKSAEFPFGEVVDVLGTIADRFVSTAVALNLFCED